MTFSKLLSPAFVFLTLSVSGHVSAQISAYDSMYFPTTQSLEGTRTAPRIYQVFNFDFSGKRAFKAEYFRDLKQNNNSINVAQNFSRQNHSANTILNSSSANGFVIANYAYDVQEKSVNQRVSERLGITSLLSLQNTESTTISGVKPTLNAANNTFYSFDDVDDLTLYSSITYAQLSVEPKSEIFLSNF